VRRYKSDAIALNEENIAKLGVADSHAILQHGFEDRLQFARRTRYDAEDLRSGRLLLQRLGKIVRALVRSVDAASCAAVLGQCRVSPDPKSLAGQHAIGRGAWAEIFG
jgi:hypothetical protein